MFMIVAIVTGQLANRLRAHVKASQQREAEIKALYLLSKRLASISNEGDIYAAIKEHLSSITGCRVYLFEAGVARPRLEELARSEQIPAAIMHAMLGGGCWRNAAES
jgi:K+-sensing histidine kinase KdpD